MPFTGKSRGQFTKKPSSVEIACQAGINSAGKFAGSGRRTALIQRSCGYALRPTLTIADIEAAVNVIRKADPDCRVIVDNCYGEFTELQEPGHVSLLTKMSPHTETRNNTVCLLSVLQSVSLEVYPPQLHLNFAKE